ncbi:MAG: type II secretion system F family protein [Jatrophihabitantaceae bacterium]
MSALSWVALAAAVLVLPVPSTERLRARALALTAGAAASAAAGPARGSVGGTVGGRAWPVGRVGASVLVPVALVVAVAGVVIEGGPVLGVAAAVLGMTVSRLLDEARKRRVRRRRDRDLLAAVRLLVAEVESGARPEAALAAAADAAPAHASVLAAAAQAAVSGVDATPALLTDRSLTSLAHAWRVAGVVGVPLAEVLSGVAADLAARAEQERAVAVALSAARSTAALLAGLPLLGIGLGAAMGASPLTFLTQSPPGRLACCAGVVLDAVGLLWTRRLARSAESS